MIKQIIKKKKVIHMKTIIADFQVNPDQLAHFLDLAKELHSKTLQEEGNVSYIFCKNPIVNTTLLSLKFGTMI